MKKPEEIQGARNRVVNLIVDISVEMTQRVVQSVSDGGNVADPEGDVESEESRPEE